MTDASLAQTGEVAGTLADYADIPCRIRLETDDGTWTLTVTFEPYNVSGSLQMLELAAALRRVRDVAQMRGFAQTYGIEPSKLEALLGDT